MDHAAFLSGGNAIRVTCSLRDISMGGNTRRTEDPAIEAIVAQWQQHREMAVTLAKTHWTSHPNEIEVMMARENAIRARSAPTIAGAGSSAGAAIDRG
jgi:hypothetical protein